MGKKKDNPYSAKNIARRARKDARVMATIREKLEHIPDGTCQPDMDRMTALIESGGTKSNRQSNYKRRVKHK